MSIAAGKDDAAASCARRIDTRAVENTGHVADDGNLPADTRLAFCFDGTRGAGGAARGDRYAAAARTVGADAAAGCERGIDQSLETDGAASTRIAVRGDHAFDGCIAAGSDLNAARFGTAGCNAAIGGNDYIAGRFQHDAPVGGLYHRIGRDHTAVAHQSRINAATAVGCLTEIERTIFRRGNFNLQARRALFSHAHRLARRQHDFTARRSDHTLVIDCRTDQHDAAAGCGADIALVDNRRRKRRIGAESHATGEKIVVADIQRRSDEAGDINPRIGTEQHAVRIDKEHATVRLQRAEDDRRIDAGDAIEHRARRRLLDEARGFRRADRELLPVDDRAGRVDDRQQTAATADRRLTADHGRSDRIGVREPSGKTRRDRHCHQLAL